MLKLSLIHIPLASERIAGFCVLADNELEAFRTIVDASKHHFELAGKKEVIKIMIGAESSKSCTISINFDHRIGSIVFEQFDLKLANKFLRDFRRSGKCFIVAGYQNEQVTILDPSIFSIVSSNVFLNNEKIGARKSIDVNINVLLSEAFSSID